MHSNSRMNNGKIVRQHYLYLLFFIMIGFLAFTASASAQTTPPRHTRLLYSADLMSSAANPMGQIVNTSGSFVAGKGWTATSNKGQLRVNLNEALPFEGTAEITVTNLNPYDQMWSQTDAKTSYTPFSLWSRPLFGYGSLYATFGSYFYFLSETNVKYNFARKSNWKVISQSYFGYGPRNGTHPYGEYTKTEPDSDKATFYYTNKEYNFKLIWSQGKAWVMIDDSLFQEHDFNGQLESFRYIVLGANLMGVSLIGPTYKNLKIYAPASPITFQNTSFSTATALDLSAGARGICWTDVNKDGLEDAFIPYTGISTAKPNALLIQKSGSVFANEASTRGVATIPSARVGAFGDVDADGDADLVVGTDKDGTYLFLNNGAGSFTNKSVARGINDKGAVNDTRQLVLLDVEGDADLDLLVTTTNLTRLYLNNGKGNFTVADRGINSALSSVGAVTRGVAAGDVNMDGAVDLVFSRANQPPVMLINDGKGNFVSEGSRRGLVNVYAPNCPTLMDYDNDGDADLFIANEAMSSGTVKKLTCYQNDGLGHFSDRTEQLDLAIDAVALLPIDVNNDGYLDFYSLRDNMDPTSATFAFRNYSKLYLNQGNGAFRELAGTDAEVNYAGIQAGATVDYDRDGRLDLSGIAYGNIHTTNAASGKVVDEFGRQYLLKNTTPVRHYLEIALKDSSGAFSKTEARVWVYQAGKAGQNDALLGYRDVAGIVNLSSHSSAILHFGLGDQTLCDVVVRYATGARVLKNAVSADQILTILRPNFVPEAAELVRISPENTLGQAGGAARDTLSVQVLDMNRLPMISHAVLFKIVDGGGHLNGTTDQEKSLLTNAQGTARVIWHLGNIAGQVNRVSATAVNSTSQPLSGSPLYFSAEVKPAADTTLQKIGGDQQSGLTLTLLADSLKIRATDHFNNSQSLIYLRFQVLTGSGAVNGSQAVTVQTNSHGEAAVAWTLGSVIGSQAQSVGVFLPGHQAAGVMFYATANSLPPAQMILVSGNGQTGKAGTELSDPLVVRLLGANGQPSVGYDVKFTVVAGGSLVNSGKEEIVRTDTSGKAAVRWTLGVTAGIQNSRVTARTVGLGDSLVFVASTTADQAAVLQKITESDGQNGRILQTLPRPFQTRVLDRYANPVSAHTVLFTVTSVQGNFSGNKTVAVLSDAGGMAGATLTFGSDIGTYAVVAAASYNDLPLSQSPVTFTATAVAAPPTDLTIEKIKGDGQFGQVNALLSDSLIVCIRQSRQTPIQGVAVDFTILSGDATIQGEKTVLSDHRGLAGVRVLAGSSLSDLEVKASVGDSIPTIFNLTVLSSIPERIVALSGNPESGTVNTRIDNLTAQVVDALGNGVAGARVHFACLTQGGQVLTTEPLRSDQNGMAQISVKLGSTTGPYIFSAAIPGMNIPAVLMTVYAQADAPVRLTEFRGNNQLGKGNEFLLYPLKVQVTDGWNNGVADIPVAFSVASGGGSLGNGATARTDSAGVAAMFWKLGASGSQSVIATTGALPGQSVAFTAQLAANALPVITAATDTSIQETRTLSMAINAYDPDGGSVELQAGYLPAGAEFDALNGRKIIWTPDYTQQGNYLIEIVATDPNGGVTVKRISIQVLNVNRAPVLRVTPDSTHLSLQRYRPRQFSVQADDPDSDSLFYCWRMGGLVLSRETQFSLLANPSLQSGFDLEVMVHDGIDSVKHVWRIQIMTFVELSDFSVTSAGDARVVNWTSAMEHNNAGFVLLTGATENGEYLRLHENILATNPSGRYQYIDRRAEYVERCYYKLQAIALDGSVQEFGPIAAVVGPPKQLRLAQNYPNPFNPETAIFYQVDEAQKIDLAIYNLAGQRVCTLHSGEIGPGYYQTRWNGRDAQGRVAVSGIYYCVLLGREQRQTIKLLLLK